MSLRPPGILFKVVLQADWMVINDVSILRQHYYIYGRYIPILHLVHGLTHVYDCTLHRGCHRAWYFCTVFILWDSSYVITWLQFGTVYKVQEVIIAYWAICFASHNNKTCEFQIFILQFIKEMVPDYQTEIILYLRGLISSYCQNKRYNEIRFCFLYGFCKLQIFLNKFYNKKYQCNNQHISGNTIWMNEWLVF